MGRWRGHLDRHPGVQRSGVDRVGGRGPARRGALARDPRRRRWVDRRHAGARRRRPARASSAIRTTRATAPRSRPAFARRPARFVLIIDADGQHQPSDAVALVSHLDAYDLVVGARSGTTQASAARRLGNAALNGIASYLTERPIPDLTSGFRAARRECLLEFLHLLPNGFSTPTTTTLAFMKAGYSVRFEPIEAAQRRGASKIRLGPDGVRFFLILLKVITIFSPLRIFLPVSAAAFLLGAAYAVWTIVTQSHVTNSSVLLILLSVVILLVGLVSEQISSLRFEGAPMTPPAALVIVPTYNERENLPVLVARRCCSSRTSACSSSTTIAGRHRRDRRRARRAIIPGRIEVMHRTGKRGPRTLVHRRDRARRPPAGRRHLPDGRRPVARPASPAAPDRRHRRRRRRHRLALRPGGAIVNWPRRRRLLSRFANIYIRLVTRLRRARLHERLSLLAARGARGAAARSLHLGRLLVSRRDAVLAARPRRSHRRSADHVRRAAAGRVEAVAGGAARVGAHAVAAHRQASRARRVARGSMPLFVLWFRGFSHVSLPRPQTRGSERLLPGVQRQRHHREHGDPRRQGRLGADAGLRGHRRQRRQRRRHGGDRRRARAHLSAGARRASSEEPRLRRRAADRLSIGDQGADLLHRRRRAVRPGGAGACSGRG